MASILPFIKKSGVVFDDRATGILGEAFDAACKDRLRSDRQADH